MTIQSIEERSSTSPANVPDPGNAVSREHRRKSLWTGGIVGGAAPRFVHQAESAHADEESGDVRRRNRRGDHHLRLGTRSLTAPQRVSDSSCRLRSGCGSRCSSRTLPKPWPKAAAKRKRTLFARRARKRWHGASRKDGSIEEIAGSKLRAGDRVRVIAGEFVPGDGEVVRRRRFRGRIRDHGRVRAGDSRVRRRSFGGYRWHSRALGRNHRRDHVESRRNIPRSHDQAR